MATDGNKIVINGIIVGEQNHSKTCLAPNILTADCILVANGPKSIAKLLATKKGILITDANGNAAKKGILITDANGNAAFIQVPDGDAGKNKILATDANSNLVWIDQDGGV